MLTNPAPMLAKPKSALAFKARSFAFNGRSFASVKISKNKEIFDKKIFKIFKKK